MRLVLRCGEIFCDGDDEIFCDDDEIFCDDDGGDDVIFCDGGETFDEYLL